VAKLTRLTYKIAIQLHLLAESCSAVLTSGGQSRNFWIHPCMMMLVSLKHWLVRAVIPCELQGGTVHSQMREVMVNNKNSSVKFQHDMASVNLVIDL
jgi:hypothetical protein